MVRKAVDNVTKKPLSRKFALALRLLSRASVAHWLLQMESEPEHFQQPIISMYLLP